MSEDEKWYKEGLRFECTGCGKCCTGGPGYVWVNGEEIKAMALFLKISESEFGRKYLRRANGKLSLIERHNHDCVFLKDKKCDVYGARPTQCRTYPFWPEHTRSPETWEHVKRECEGIRDSARLIPVEEIEQVKLIQIKRNNNH